MPYEKLSALDSSFLYLERGGPLHVGSLAIFEGGQFFDHTGRLRIADAQRTIAGRLHLLPNFRKKLMGVPLGQGHPVWVDDSDFDLTHHVRLAALPDPGDDGQLKELMAQIQAQPLDRRRPLWELWFVEGLVGGRVAIIQKTHHALVDGISGVDVARVLLDREPEPPAPAEVTAEWVPRPAPSRAALLGASLVDQGAAAARVLRSAGTALRQPLKAAEAAARLGRAALVGGRFAPRSSLNVPVGPGRRFESFRVDLREVNAVKRALHCTANDVVLATVAGGLCQFLAVRGDPVDGLTLRVMVPVSLRKRSERMALGNRVSVLFVDLPVSVTDPVERVRTIRDEMDRRKRSQQAQDVDWLLSCAERFTPPLYAAVAARLPSLQRTVNLVVTNVPGPSFPLYCMGGRMVEGYPYLGPIEGMALMVSVLRYDSQLFFGLGADADAVPDLPVLVEAMEKAIAELIGQTPAETRQAGHRHDSP